MFEEKTLFKWVSYLATGGSVLAVSMASGCVDSFGPAGVVDVRGFVTPELEATLDANGSFRYPPPDPDTQYPIIGPSTATALASSLLEHSNGAVEILQSTGNRTLVFSDLEIVSDAAFFATSPLEDVPTWVSLPSRRLVGPWYLFPITAGGRPIGTVSISAWATDYGLAADGTIRFPRWGGNAFRVGGYTESTGQFTVPFRPEQAAALVADRTGGLVAALPRLISAIPPHDPATAFKWEIQLDREVEWQFGTGGGSITSRTVYVGLEPTPVASGVRDEAVTTFYQPGTAPDSIIISVSIRDSASLVLIDTVNLGVPIRSNVPAAFVVVR